MSPFQLFLYLVAVGCGLGFMMLGALGIWLLWQAMKGYLSVERKPE